MNMYLGESRSSKVYEKFQDKCLSEPSNNKYKETKISLIIYYALTFYEVYAINSNYFKAS